MPLGGRQFQTTSIEVRIIYKRSIANTESLATENYLGHSINAPVGRWQKNKDIHWYSRDVQASDAERADQERKEEIRKLKEAEEDALAIALGLAPKKRDENGFGEGSGSNTIAVKGTDDEEKELRKRAKE